MIINIHYHIIPAQVVLKNVSWFLQVGHFFS